MVPVYLDSDTGTMRDASSGLLPRLTRIPPRLVGYPREWEGMTMTTTTTTRHAQGCRMAFGRPDLASGCPRCHELAQGAPARRQPWRELRAHNAAMERHAVAEHFKAGGPHDRGVCGPVCT